MDKPKTDESVKAGLQIEAGHKGEPETKKDKTVSSYDKRYNEEEYDKDEEGKDTHYDKNTPENEPDK